MTDWNRQKFFSILCCCWALAVPSADASILDPVPISQNIPESPPKDSHLSEKTRPFFYLLSKNFCNDSEKIAAETLMLEALGEGYEGMVAVGEVIRNREKLFLKDPKEVCLMPKQFSAWNNAASAERFLERYRDYYFIAAVAWIESAKSSLTNGATDYHTVSVRPYWAKAYRLAARIKHHLFYVREKPAAEAEFDN